MAIARSISICVISGNGAEQPGLAADEACRDEGSGRVPEPTGTPGETVIVAPNRLQRLVNATPDDKRHCPERITYGGLAA